MTFSPNSRRGTRRGERPPRGAAAPSRTPFPELLAPAGSVGADFAAVSARAGGASRCPADVCAALGADQVILERPLDLSEVRRIVSASRVGVEIFVHGAMCYSYSGKCFFSSFLGGKSGTRGACVQPGRRLFGHPGGEEAVFSTRDLSLLDLLPELVSLWVA